jgi:TPR repeat protein
MDNFSLAGTLIFAATGHYPFAGSNNSEWRESILFSAPDLSGLSSEQVNVLSPLLYKKPEERGSLEIFSKLLEEIEQNSSDSKLIKKEFAKVKRDSRSKLTQKKKNLAVKNRSLRRIVSAASIVSLLSISLVAFAIVVIQNKSSEIAADSSQSIGQMTKSPQPMTTIGESLPTSEQSGTLGGGIQKDNSPINKEIQANLDLTKKFYDANQLDKALTYAKLAAEAGNAQGMYRVAFILVDQGKSQEAVQWYEKAANLGYGDAFWNLGALYMKLGKTELGLSWYEKGVKNNNVGSMNSIGFYYGDKKDDYRKAIAYYKKAADLGSVLGMSNLGIAYEELNDKANARIWYTKASDLGSVDASINLGYLYEQSADWTNARKYYKRAADKKDPLGMYNLAIVLGNQFGMGDQGCVLLREALLIDSIEAGTKKLIDTAIAQGCSTTANESRASSSSAKPSDGDLQPALNYKSSEYSEKLSSSVNSSSIFGRAFLRDLDWIIPLTNSSNESVPPINRVQFRDASLPYGSWWNMPYTLVNGGNVGWHAVVSNLGIQIGHSTGKKVCPEFRFALVQNGLVTYTWAKSVEPCTVP